MAQPAPLFILASAYSDPIGPFPSRLSASDWRSDAVGQGLIHPGYVIRKLIAPAPLIEPGL